MLAMSRVSPSWLTEEAARSAEPVKPQFRRKDFHFRREWRICRNSVLADCRVGTVKGSLPSSNTIPLGLLSVRTGEGTMLPSATSASGSAVRRLSAAFSEAVGSSVIFARRPSPTAPRRAPCLGPRIEQHSTGDTATGADLTKIPFGVRRSRPDPWHVEYSPLSWRGDTSAANCSAVPPVPPSVKGSRGTGSASRPCYRLDAPFPATSPRPR
jgi:hypothetical protein